MATGNQTGLTEIADEPRTSRVLVVDDNPQNQELLAAYLETMDVEVRIADDGLTALQQVAADPPDLILLDIMMPRMSGFEVCTKLKSDPATRDIPVIMVTALDSMADIQRAVDCGTDDFLSRPLSRLELVTRVRNLLKVRHLKNELDRTLEYLSEIEKRPTAP
ncbi:MAG: response regulator [Planctomycetes bacterium]|nr:response regulator [Planctomycetota bacterium]